MSSTSQAIAGRSSPTQTSGGPRLMIITDHTELGRALEHHITVVFPDAECRVHAPLVSGRLHSAFTALGFDAVVLDDRIERGRGEEWLDNLLRRESFPPILYLASGEDSEVSKRVMTRGIVDCFVRERIDHRRFAVALRDAVQRRRQDLALMRTSAQGRTNSTFGPVTIRGHRFVRELAVGGNALVYLAESERAGDMVVLKVLNETAASGDPHAQFARFLQEYELISRIRHPNVVRIYDLGIADDHAYIAMEYFSLGDLRGHIASGLRPAEALSYLRQMAEALQIVHAVGVLHRDLKPGNIMMRADSSIALIDFGLAKHADMTVDITGTGEIFGTPYYMSPEQGHGRELDARSDLYSLGVIFYEMLTGKKPFLAANPMAVLYLHGNAPVPQLDAVHTSYQPLIDRLLAKEPGDRFVNAGELVRHIDQLLPR
ncbi:MAG: protein kinase domain-containing protein [Povalibacter sp.]